MCLRVSRCSWRASLSKRASSTSRTSLRFDSLGSLRAGVSGINSLPEGEESCKSNCADGVPALRCHDPRDTVVTRLRQAGERASHPPLPSSPPSIWQPPTTLGLRSVMFTESKALALTTPRSTQRVPLGMQHEARLFEVATWTQGHILGQWTSLSRTRFRSLAWAPPPEGWSCSANLLQGLSSQRGLAVVVVQHLDPHYESQLSSILQTHTPLRVVDAMHGHPRRSRAVERWC